MEKEKFIPRKIFKDSEPIVRENSQLVTLPLSKEDKETMDYMLEHLRLSQDDEKSNEYSLRAGVGLAAPQLGILKQMIAIRIAYEEEDGKQEIVTYGLINPKVVAHSNKKAYLESGEGCLSVEYDHEGYVIRHANVTVRAYDFFTNETKSFKFRGYEAMVIQHEIDHLHGVLYYDHINKEDPYFKPKDSDAIL